jgi:hypothetical protein
VSLGSRFLLHAALVALAVAALTLGIPYLTSLGLDARSPTRPQIPRRSKAHRSQPSRPLVTRPQRVEVSPVRRGALAEVTVALWLVAAATIASLPAMHVRRRLRARKGRDYRPYRLHLSMHDQAQPPDLAAMSEQLVNAVRSLPEEYLRTGQRCWAFESHYGHSSSGLEWIPMVRCLARDVEQIEAAYQAAYPDVRLGRVMGEEPAPVKDHLPMPGHVMRFRKQRAFIHPLSELEDESAPLLEQLANAQAALGRASSVRLQLTPAPAWFETLARSAYRRAENRLARQETPGLRAAGLRGTLNRDELRAAAATQNRGLLWLECVVAATTREDCRRIAATLQARRAANRLHRRMLVARRGLYRRRFPDAVPPLLPSFQALISAVEAARLLELPSARMKGVAAQRLSLPRLPAPPQATRATDRDPVAIPTDDMTAATAPGAAPAK